jgi:hypothetical protein
MARFNSSLDNVRIAAPCSADWDSMLGDERVRFCGQCKLNVFNLSELTKNDAEHLIGQAEGRLCVRYYQRKDGSIITRDCPVGLQAIKRRLSRVANAIVSLIVTFFAGVGAYAVADWVSLIRVGPPVAVAGALVPVRERVVMGEMPLSTEDVPKQRSRAKAH